MEEGFNVICYVPVGKNRNKYVILNWLCDLY